MLHGLAKYFAERKFQRMALKDLLSDEAFCRRLEAANDADEAIKLFAEKGITVTKEQLNEAGAAGNQEELDEEALDGVSGGITLRAASQGIRFLAELIRRGNRSIHSGGFSGGGSGGVGGRSW